jgi:Tol biopolymer transport system component
VPVSELAPLTPPALDHVIRKCLAKDPDDRWQSIHDVADQLRWISDAGSKAGEAAPVLARKKTKLRMAWALHAATALVAVGATIGVMQFREERPRTTRLSLLPPDKMTFDPQFGAMALSPDGRRIAFLARGENGPRMLWVRSLDALSAQPLAGTEDSFFPFWSPDSRYIGFFSTGKLRKIDANGGPPFAICDAADFRGGTWGKDGTILFTPSPRDPIYSVSSAGGVSTAVTAFDAKGLEASHRFPSFLPDGKHFLFLVEENLAEGRTGDFGLWIGSLGSKERRRVLTTNSSARYATSGHILFLRDRTLVAQRFNARSLELEGEPVPVAENLTRTLRWETTFSLSDTGTLAYQAGVAAELSQLVVIDREGKDVRVAGKPADYRTIALSHDGKRIAASVLDSKTQKTDIWVIGVERGTSTRITFDPEDDNNPSWSADDRYIHFTSYRQGNVDMFRKSSSGTGVEELVLGDPGSTTLMSVTADGKTGAAITQTRQGWDISLMDMEKRTVKPFVQTPFNELFPMLTRDGRWLLYHSNESGRAEVYVQRIDGEGGKWQISTDGGARARWGRGEREIVYLSGDKLMLVDVQLGPEFSASVPRPWMTPGVRPAPGPQFAMSPDGSHVLVNRLIDVPVVTPVTIVQNWVEDLPK